MAYSKFVLGAAGAGMALSACCSKMVQRGSAPTTMLAARGSALLPPAAASTAASAKAAEQSPEEGIWVYFGSQSGTAQRFAEELEEQAAQYDLKMKVVDLEEFDEEAFVRHRCVVLMMATYGEGDPTDNAMDFCKWLQSDAHDAGLLSSVKFTVMGLGNRQYIHFNSIGKMVDRRMEELGASRVYNMGIGDDDHNLEEDWEQWKEHGFWPALRAACGLAESDAQETAVQQLEDVVSKLPLTAVLFDGAPPLDPMVASGGSDVVGKWYFAAHLASIVQCDELRQKPDARKGLTTKHIEFDIKPFPNINWKTADNLEVLPSNTQDDVDWFAKRLGVSEKLGSKVTFVRAHGDKVVRVPFPCPETLGRILELYCDLCSAPVRNTAKKYSTLIKDQADRAALEGILADRELYQMLTTGATRISLREFFELFLPSANVDISAFLQLCARQKNRPYTIASSSKENSQQIGICVSMVREELKSLKYVVQELDKKGHKPPRADALLQQGDVRRIFDGACSTMLCTRVAKGDRCWIHVRASGFKLPKKNTAPIVMVAAGTGIAPFHAYLREFWAEGGSRKKTLLFFGCWRKDEDYIYREEIERAVKHSPQILTDVMTAFSREQAQKVYVQHRFKERAAELKGLSSEDAHFYVCGSTSMGAAIRQELAEILGSEESLKKLQKEGRFYEELW